MTRWRAFLFSLLLTCSAAQNLSDTTLGLVEQRLAEGATHSWELGTRTQALLDFTASNYSVFSLASNNGINLPPPAVVASSLNSSLSTVISIARTVVQNLNSSKATNDALPLFPNDTSAGDPASMGVAVLLANWTGASGGDFATAARQELNYLLNVAPRAPSGAISHRVDQVQLWSDSVYMVPPFLAYYGVMTNNQTLLSMAYDQIHFYHDALKDTNKSANGLWQHIVLGTPTDPGHWSTGNGWAALGMLRVLATIKNSQYANPLKSEMSTLSGWVNEIHSGMYPLLDSSSSLFHNYASDTTSFLDASSTALLAASVYRTALLTNTHHFLPFAERSRKALSATGSNGTTHFDANGWLTPVVNPENTGLEGSDSPEGQAFVLEMQSAYQDWVNAGSPGANAAISIKAPPTLVLVSGVAFTLITLLA